MAREENRPNLGVHRSGPEISYQLGIHRDSGEQEAILPPFELNKDPSNVVSHKTVLYLACGIWKVLVKL